MFLAKIGKNPLKTAIIYSIIHETAQWYPKGIWGRILGKQGEITMTTCFGTLPSGETASLYTIRQGRLTAAVTDCGATLVSLTVDGTEVLLGFEGATDYIRSTCFIGAVVGRSANRIGGARFVLDGQEYRLAANENGNNLHSGPDCWHLRLWKVTALEENAISLSLHSPDGDQGFPGNATVTVTYRLENNGLHILYDGDCDRDTVFNLTNHAYFNLAGQDKPEKAMDQVLTIRADRFTPADAEGIPTGEERCVEGTPMDFRTPKAIGRDIGADYECLKLQGGYDHNWIIAGNPCAVLTDPASGRTMEVHTDCPGIQFYAGNFLSGDIGRGGTVYGKRTGVCLETQLFPNSINTPAWPQPVTKAGAHYHSETEYRFV